MRVESSPWGATGDGLPVNLYTLENEGGVTVKVSDYGCTVTSIISPDRRGEPGDIVLGFSDLDDYLESKFYFGCVVGRYANRIANASFTIDGVEHRVTRNSGRHHLHGGEKGFDKVVWHAQTSANAENAKLRLHYHSRDGEEGYPGGLDAWVTYTLNNLDELMIGYEAVCDKPTVVNLTNHTYFNLACGGNILGHELMIDADRFTPVDLGLIPTGELLDVTGTPMDFREPRRVGEEIEKGTLNGVGYDCNYVLNRVSAAVSLRDPGSGRALTVSTTQLGVQ
ncbi:galactose mutarotase, partial [Candidatus Bathyarchaeota archaeon]|nr:galactose mutarotase [Candidatus Bathyarchaeota archaeon]